MKNELQQKLDALGWAEPAGNSYNGIVFALLKEIVRCLIYLCENREDAK